MSAGSERRRSGRTPPDAAGWRDDAVLRPGLLVHVVNVGSFGALVEGPTRLRPGRAAELQLVSAAGERKHTISGRVERCHVVRLQPLEYCGAISFDAALQPHPDG
jgi:hypothetical protein